MSELRRFAPFSLSAPDRFDDGLRALVQPWQAGLADAAPRIQIDLPERGGRDLVKAGNPGGRKDDIDVRIDGDLVTIIAGTKTAKQDNERARASGCSRTTAWRFFR